jgi:hypothetical protein
MLTTPNCQRPFRRFMRWFLSLLGGYFLLTAILSLTVNPWRINRSPLSIDALDEARDIRKNLRVGKAALANYGDWQVVLFGSSRVEQAFDPTHTAFGGRRTVNLAMAAASVLETVPVAHYTLDRNPDIETILFGIDAGDLTSDFDSRKHTRFDESPFADGGFSIERGINQIIGGRSFLDSIGTIQRKFMGERPDRTPLGQWVDPNHPNNLRRYVEHAFSRGFENPRKGWDVEAGDLRKHKADLLFEFLVRARREGIELHLFVPVQHALKIVHPEHDRPDGMCWEADLMALASVCEEANRFDAPGPPVIFWNFLDFSPLNTCSLPKPAEGTIQMEGWYDLGHAQREVGSKILETILGTANMSTGLTMPLAVWDKLRADWLDAHQRYCRDHPNDVAWWRGLAKKATKANVSERLMVEDPQ